jgi:hypothetical protein
MFYLQCQCVVSSTAGAHTKVPRVRNLDHLRDTVRWTSDDSEPKGAEREG